MELQNYKNLFQDFPIPLYCVDINRVIIEWNRSCEYFVGYSKNEVVGNRCDENILMHSNENGRLICDKNNCHIQKVLNDGKIRKYDLFIRHKKGHLLPVSVRVTPIKDSSGIIIGACETLYDNMNISYLEEIRKLKKEIYIDPLTNIGNRKFCIEKLNDIYNSYLLNHDIFGILFIDIDYFKQINDNYGHNIGDQILEMISTTMVNSLRGDDIICRWGGEEFIVIVPKCDYSVLYRIADRLRIFVESSKFTIGNNSIGVTVSIGGVIINEDETISDLLQRADELMYKSKDKGRNKVYIDVSKHEFDIICCNACI